MLDKLQKYWQKIVMKLKALKGTPYAIAAGPACGVVISLTPFVGLHTLLAVVIAWLIRANVLAAALGTIVGNPWTFPFIWLTTLYTGRLLLGINHTPVDFEAFFDNAGKALLNFDFDLFFQDIWPILWPMMVGCIPFCIIAWGVTYVFMKRLIEKWHGKHNFKEQ